VPQPHTRLSAQERRSQLLDVAGGLFAELGFHGLSMGRLAEAAGVSKPVVYQHFASKRMLYLTLVEDATTELDFRVTQALTGTSDNRARVEGAISAYFDFVEDRRFRLLFATAELNDPEVRDIVERTMAGVASAVGRLIAADAGLSKSSANFLAAGVSALAVEGASWWLQHDDLDKDEAARLLSRLVWRGLGAFGPPD
jgi:AcrR family transcriptional regulator